MEGDRFRMTVNDRLRYVITILTNGPPRWGNDKCGCDNCAELRIAARMAAMMAVNEVIRDLGR